mmetsp:Transcript_38693/g.101495  ORF Transcript_38693/g.101495 Transcript_38693/m.101495 type:complete len:275 (-) Transcript_38693:381-1205(-)
MSTCAHGVSLTNSLRKSAAVIEPPPPAPTFFRSAIVLLHCSAYSLASGIFHSSSPVSAAAPSKLSPRSSSDVQRPAYSGPSATMTAPVSVAMSTIASICPRASAYTSASARVRRPSASVLMTSIVFWLEATRMSPGRIASAETMFSHAATMKCTSTPLGARPATTRAVPSTAPAPPMSNFIFSIIDPAPALMLYPPESNVSPLPTRPSFLVAGPSGGVYVRWMNLGGSHAPCETPRYAPMPRASHSSFSSTLSERQSNSSARAAAVAAIEVGVR